MKCEVKRNGIWEWDIYGLMGEHLSLNRWGIYGLMDGAFTFMGGAFILNGWGICDIVWSSHKLMFCLEVIMLNKMLLFREVPLLSHDYRFQSL